MTILAVFLTVAAAFASAQTRTIYDGSATLNAVWHADGTVEILAVQQSIGQLPDANDIRGMLTGLHFFKSKNGGDTPITVQVTFGHPPACTAITGPSIIIRAVVRPDGSLTVGTIQRNLDVSFTPKCTDVPTSTGGGALPA